MAYGIDQPGINYQKIKPGIVEVRVIPKGGEGPAKYGVFSSWLAGMWWAGAIYNGLPYDPIPAK